jgi:hypothetical protein
MRLRTTWPCHLAKPRQRNRNAAIDASYCITISRFYRDRSVFAALERELLAELATRVLDHDGTVRRSASYRRIFLSNSRKRSLEHSNWFDLDPSSGQFDEPQTLGNLKRVLDGPRIRCPRRRPAFAGYTCSRLFARAPRRHPTYLPGRHAICSAHPQEDTMEDHAAIDERSYPADRFIGDQLAFAAQYAQLAPSNYNSQPWSFIVDGNSVHLKAERANAVPFVDPYDRELDMSCGAALFHLRVALTHFGHDTIIEIGPSITDPDVLATVAAVGKNTPASETDRLFHAIPRRHTNRGPFIERTVPEALVRELGDIARAEGAWFVPVEGTMKERLALLVSEGDRLQMADPRFRRELASWIHASRASSGDGMPAYAERIADLRVGKGSVALRTFDTMECRAAKDADLARGSPLLVVLGTDGDTEPDWVRAGQALDHILLRATDADVAASFLNQPIEVPELRGRVVELIGRAYPQLVLRLGYPAHDARSTPRRGFYSVVHRRSS